MKREAAMKVFGRESHKADPVLEAQLVLFRRPTNNPTGDLEAISNSKETFVKATMIGEWAVWIER